MTNVDHGFYTTAAQKTNERRAFDFYPTSPGFVETAVKRVYRHHIEPDYRWPQPMPQRYNVLDVGAGTGYWGTAVKHLFGRLRPVVHVTGVEVQDMPCPPEYDTWINEDFKRWVPLNNYDLVIGNPPYPRDLDRWVEKCYAALNPSGWLVWLLNTSFLEGERRLERLYTKTPPTYIYQVSKRISFTPGSAEGKPARFSLICWQKGGEWFDVSATNQKPEPQAIFRWMEPHENVWQFTWEKTK